MSEPRPIPQIWGVVNVTPDSFSDGGRYLDTDAAIAHGLALAEQGADVLDIGGESTRPGADPVSEDEEIRRVVPVLEALRAAGSEAQLSIDTRHAAVAAAALDAGATIVNDVSAGLDPEMLPLVARSEVECVLMHMQGEPGTMQAAPHYDDVVAEVREYLGRRVEAAVNAGIDPALLWIDPGIGFGKTLEHNLALLRNLEAFVSDARVLLGTSRKSFLGRLTGREDPGERIAGSLVCAVRAALAGVHAVRVHDVAATHDALRVFAEVR